MQLRATELPRTPSPRSSQKSCSTHSGELGREIGPRLLRSGPCAATAETRAHQSEPSKHHADKPLGQTACSTGCSTWSRVASRHSLYQLRFTCKIAFFESRRADSNRLPLLITSDRSCVAGVCRGMQIPHIYAGFFSPRC